MSEYSFKTSASHHSFKTNDSERTAINYPPSMISETISEPSRWKLTQMTPTAPSAPPTPPKRTTSLTRLAPPIDCPLNDEDYTAIFISLLRETDTINFSTLLFFQDIFKRYKHILKIQIKNANIIKFKDKDLLHFDYGIKTVTEVSRRRETFYCKQLEHFQFPKPNPLGRLEQCQKLAINKRKEECDIFRQQLNIDEKLFETMTKIISVIDHSTGMSNNSLFNIQYICDLLKQYIFIEMCNLQKNQFCDCGAKKQKTNFCSECGQKY